MSFINPLTCSLTHKDIKGAGSMFWVDSRYHSDRPFPAKGTDIKRGVKEERGINKHLQYTPQSLHIY
jgi:hypothetical protein